MKKAFALLLVFASLITLSTVTGALDFALGDLNFDGATNSLDAALILKHDALLSPLFGNPLSLADVNADGEVNSLDAALVLRHDAKLIEMDCSVPEDGEGTELGIEGNAFSNCGLIDIDDLWSTSLKNKCGANSSHAMHKFENREELDLFIRKYNKDNQFGAYDFEDMPSAAAVFARCDEAFFEEYTLFLMYLVSSSSVDYGICGVTYYENSKKLVICYKYTRNPDVITADEEGYFLTVPVRKADIEGCKLYDTSFEDDGFVYLPNEARDGYVLKQAGIRNGQKGIVEILEKEGAIPAGSALVDFWIEGTYLDQNRIAHAEMNSAFADGLTQNQEERALYLGCLVNSLMEFKNIYHTNYTSIVVSANGQLLHEGTTELCPGMEEVPEYILVYKNNGVTPPAQADMYAGAEVIRRFIRALYDQDAEVYDGLMTDKHKDLAEISRLQDNYVECNGVRLWSPEEYTGIWRYSSMADTIKISYYDNAEAEFPCNEDGNHLILEYHWYFDDYGNDYDTYVVDMIVDEDGNYKINYFGLSPRY